MTATGLAAFANKTKSPELMRQARRQYALALRIINETLGSPVDAVKDSTLQAVLLIAMWETTAGSQQRTDSLTLKHTFVMSLLRQRTYSSTELLEEWRHHMHGTAALLTLRGRAQLESPASFKLFMYASTQVILGCYHREVPVPPELVELREEAFRMIGDDPFWKYLKAIDEFMYVNFANQTSHINDANFDFQVTSAAPFALLPYPLPHP